MGDTEYKERARQQLERDLVSAKSVGDDNWVKAINAELKELEPEPEPAPKPAAKATKATKK